MTTLKHILRRLGNFPAFTAITIATLAIGIGANGAIFAVIENVLLKPLPFPDSAQLVDLGHDVPGIGLHGRSAPFLYFTYADQSRSFQSIGVWRENSNNLTGLAESEHVRSLEPMFIAEGARLAAIGILCGTATALGLMRLIGSLLFGVKPIDPLTYAAVALALTAAAVIASYIPAMRATKVDPVDALRAE